MFDRELRELSFVSRWGIARTLKRQSVAEHSYYVAVYALQIAQFINWGGDLARLLERALWHDIEETVTGDIPGPVKHRVVKQDSEYLHGMLTERFPDYPYPWSKMDDANGEVIIKLANYVDEIAFLATEKQMGNGNAKILLNQMHDKAFDLIDTWSGINQEYRTRLMGKLVELRRDHEVIDSKIPVP